MLFLVRKGMRLVPLLGPVWTHRAFLWHWGGAGAAGNGRGCATSEWPFHIKRSLYDGIHLPLHITPVTPHAGSAHSTQPYAILTGHGRSWSDGTARFWRPVGAWKKGLTMVKFKFAGLKIDKTGASCTIMVVSCLNKYALNC